MNKPPTEIKTKVLPYDPRWRFQFETESAALANALGVILEKVHHIGSTAVEGLSAKPIIDIILEVRSLDSLDQATSKLEMLGYEAKGEFGIPGRRYFRKGGFHRTHQIHAFKSGDFHVFRHLAFRDYLRAHPDVVREYAELKLRLALECKNDLEKYCDGKDPFVKHHETKALDWRL